MFGQSPDERRFSQGLGLVVPPQPAQRIGQNRSTVAIVVISTTHHEFVVISGKLEGSIHLPVDQRPVAVSVVEIILSILKKNPDRFFGRFANEGRVIVAALT